MSDQQRTAAAQEWAAIGAAAFAVCSLAVLVEALDWLFLGQWDDWWIILGGTIPWAALAYRLNGGRLGRSPPPR